MSGLICDRWRTARVEQTASQRAVRPAGLNACSEDVDPVSASQETELNIEALKILAVTAMDSVRNELVID